MMEKKVLILGITGMLGSMVYSHLSENLKIDTYGTARRYANFNLNNIYNFSVTDSKQTSNILRNIIDDIEPDFIINCIGVINKHCNDRNEDNITNAINVNSLFPHILNDVCINISPKIKIIQIATDCVFNGNKGRYTEYSKSDAWDIYGKSKWLGEVVSKYFLNIRCSIIGPEIYNKINLLEWFLSIKANEEIKGYNNHYWNGITTLQFAKFIETIIIENNFKYLRNLHHTIHYVPNKKLSKYELLKLFNEIFNKEINIKKHNCNRSIDRTLESDFLNINKSNIKKALIQLKEKMDNGYYEEQKCYNRYGNL